MNVLQKSLILLFSSLAAVALSGCMSHLAIQSSHATSNDGPPIEKTRDLKGRAFVLHNVSIANESGPKNVKDHCLPNEMYIKMLRHDIKEGFKNAGLANGKQPPVPVNVSVFYQWYSQQIAATLMFGSDETPIGEADLKGEHHPWTAHISVIPALAIKITRGLASIKNGHAFDSEFPWILKSSHNWHGFGIKNPMPVAQIERITGRNIKQIKRLCRHRIAAAQ